jgi:hypothetical protein
MDRLQDDATESSVEARDGILTVGMGARQSTFTRRISAIFSVSWAHVWTVA